MALRKKINIAILAFYWPLLFVLAHIPIPQVVYKAQVSDKSLHFLAYLILIFLLWFAFYPNAKINAQKRGFWWILIISICYSAADELIQKYVGRSCDLRDFLANITGISAAIVLMSIFTFWPSLLLIAAITIFLLVNLARTNIVDLMPYSCIVFYVVSYALFTTILIAYLKLIKAKSLSIIKYSIIVVIVPLSLLAVVESSSVMLGRFFGPLRPIASATGICIVIMVHVILKSLPVFLKTKSVITDS